MTPRMNVVSSNWFSRRTRGRDVRAQTSVAHGAIARTGCVNSRSLLRPAPRRSRFAHALGEGARRGGPAGTTAPIDRPICRFRAGWTLSSLPSADASSARRYPSGPEDRVVNRHKHRRKRAHDATPSSNGTAQPIRRTVSPSPATAPANSSRVAGAPSRSPAGRPRRQLTLSHCHRRRTSRPIVETIGTPTRPDRRQSQGAVRRIFQVPAAAAMPQTFVTPAERSRRSCRPAAARCCACRLGLHRETKGVGHGCDPRARRRLCHAVERRETPPERVGRPASPSPNVRGRARRDGSRRGGP